MLLNYRIDNYKSFSNPQSFSMVPGGYRKKKTHVASGEKYNALKLSTLYGGNAAGKSNFVSAISLCKSIVISGSLPKSFTDVSFRLDNDRKESNFEFEIVVKNMKYIFGLSVNTSKRVINNEYIYRGFGKNPKLVYDFDYTEKVFEINEKIISKENLNRIEIYKNDNVKQKSTIFLSDLYSKEIQNNDDFIESINSVYEWFKSTLTIVTPNSEPIDVIGLFDDVEDSDINHVIEIIKEFDTGITNFKKVKLDFDQFIKTLKKKVSGEAVEEFEDIQVKVNELKVEKAISMIIDNEYYKIKIEDGKPIVEHINFEHCYKSDFDFSFKDESDGTKRLIELVNLLFLAQFTDKVFVVDELNRSLHPNVTYSFVEKFLHYSKNNASQLIITTHEAALLTFDLLRQDEIWLIDRDYKGSSDLFPLSKYKVRSDKVLNKDYLDGRYGGVPLVSRILTEAGV